METNATGPDRADIQQFDLAARVHKLEANLICERHLKLLAREQWGNCQERLADIEALLISITGEQTDILSNIETLKRMAGVSH